MPADATTAVQPADAALVPAMERLHELTDLGEAHASWAGIRTEWMDVAGAHTRLLRRDGNPDGPTVLLIHGLGGTATNWLSIMEGLSEIGDVIAVDLPGFGETAPPRPTSARPRANARFVATLLGALDVGAVVLVGNSMGGAVATLVAADHPELVDHLVLLGPALPPKLIGLVPTKVQISGFGPMLLPVLGPRIIKRRLASMTFEEQYREGMLSMAADPTTVTDEQVTVGIANLARVKALRWRGAAFREATTGLMELQMGPARRVMFSAIRRVEAPTLYVRGLQDPLVLPGTTKTVRRLRPDWTVEEPDAMGHIPMMEAVSWTAERITRFVRGAQVTPLAR